LCKFVAFGQQFGPDLFKDIEFNPMLKDAVNLRVVAEFFGQMVPLTTGAKPIDDRIDDRIKDRPPIITRTTVGAGGSNSSSIILMISQRSSDTSQIVGYDCSHAIGILLELRFVNLQSKDKTNCANYSLSDQHFSQPQLIVAI
jgi:hypothetical protein